MEIRKAKIKEEGSCTFCQRGELKLNGMGLDFPYDEIIYIRGNHTVIRLCQECFNKIIGFKEYI